jgi:endonuclease/exonuclease/phosphatase family metal-dependent hydrolase
MCAVLFRADRLEKLEEGHFWLSESPKVVGSRDWDAALTRMATWVRLRVKASGRQLVFLNTHFDHVGREARRKSAELLRWRAEEIARGAPVILAGDFNAPSAAGEEGPYRVLAEGGFVDTFRQIHPEARPNEGTYHGFAGDTAGARIDWILVSPEVEVLAGAIDQTRRAGRYPSDHFPVTAVVVLRAAASTR